MSVINIRENYATKTEQLKKELGVKNVMALPKITKVSINIGLSQNRQNKEMVEYIEKSLIAISGQKSVKTHAKKAIAGFKLRTGDLVGMRVTLRGTRMNDFLTRLLNITMPRIRDFRGFDPHQLDRQGNLTIGFKDQVPFAEMGHDVLDKPFGLTVTITIKNSDPAKTVTMLKTLGFPFKNK
jgi:large subunit ribosomal protein L5